MNPYSQDLASPSFIETCLFDYQNNIVRTIFEKKKDNAAEIPLY